MDWELDFRWSYTPTPENQSSIEEDIQATINDYWFDDLPVCPGAVLQVSLGSSDHGLSKFGGNVSCQCGRSLLAFRGKSDGSGIEFWPAPDQ